METMTPTNTDPTAKDFQEPLLVALHQLSAGKAGVPVAFRDTYEPVMKLKGIPSLDAFGTMADGKEKVAQWIQWAYKNLKRTGHVDDQGRGQWVLTKDGLTEAEKVIKMTTPTPVAQPDPVQVPSGVPSPVSRGYAEDGCYHPDPYIRTLAANATRCFGHYSHKSDVCVRCPLQGPCINFLAVELSALAAVLRREDEEAARKAAAEAARRAAAANKPATPAAPAAPDPLPPAPAADGFDWSEWQTDKKRFMMAKAETTCPKCRLPVQSGSKAVWLRLRSTAGGRNRSVLFHVECGPPDSGT